MWRFSGRLIGLDTSISMIAFWHKSSVRDPDYSMENVPLYRLNFPPPRIGCLSDIVKIEVREADYFGTGALPFSTTQGWLLLEQRWSRE